MPDYKNMSRYIHEHSARLQQSYFPEYVINDKVNPVKKLDIYISLIK